jgi:hypothetical protein
MFLQLATHPPHLSWLGNIFARAANSLKPSPVQIRFVIEISEGLPGVAFK